MYDEQQRWHDTRYDTNDTIDRHHEKAWHPSHLPLDVRKTKIMAKQDGGCAERSEKVHYQASETYLDNSVSMPSSRLSQFASSTSDATSNDFLANQRYNRASTSWTESARTNGIPMQSANEQEDLEQEDLDAMESLVLLMQQALVELEGR